MSEQMSMFDFMEDGEQYKPIKSTDWKWTFADYPKQKNGIKVFSCFACGGGSTMGYKLAGCDVLGCCEIDKQMNDIYVENHHPKFNFLMDIRDFNNLPDSEIPEELFDIDILDGSPPCTTFSISGDREDTWGKAVIPMPLDFGFYNMDCMEGMRQFPDKFFDLAIVDPVYGDVTKGGYITHNVGQHIGTGKANQKGYHAGLWQQEKTGAEYFEELRRVSKNQIVWGGQLLYR